MSCGLTRAASRAPSAARLFAPATSKRKQRLPAELRERLALRAGRERAGDLLAVSVAGDVGEVRHDSKS